MRYKALILSSIILCILFTGCKSEKLEGEKNMNDKTSNDKVIDEKVINEDKVEQETLATKEFLMETFQLSEADIEKYDVEELITYFELTEEFFLQEKEYLEDLSSITSEFESFQKIMEESMEDDKYNFTYLFEQDEYVGEFPDIKTIRYLAVSDQSGTGGVSFVMDFENGTIYDSYYSDNVYRDVRYASEEVKLTEKKKNEIIKALEDAKIWEWDYSYSNNSEVGMESWWHFGVAFQDGTVISYKGAGEVPDNYSTLEPVLFKR